MPSFRPTRRQLLAGLGASGVAGLGAATTGAVTVEGVSPAWRAWRSRLKRPNRVLAGTEDRVFAVQDQRLVVFDRSHGYLETWRELTAGSGGYALGGATAGHGQVYAGVDELEAFDQGEHRWGIAPDVSGGTELQATPVTTEEVVVGVFEGSILVGVTPGGDRIWRTGLPAEHLALAGDATGIYALAPGGADEPEQLFGLDPATGAVRWEREVDLPVNAPYHNLATGPGVVLLGGGGLVAFGTDSGTLRWRDDDERVNAATVVDGRVVAVGGESSEEEVSIRNRRTSGFARGLDTDTGQRRWETSLQGEALFPPAAGDDELLVTDRSWGLQSLGPGGERRWRVSLNLPPKAGRRRLTRPVPGDPHVVGTDGHLVGVAERSF